MTIRKFLVALLLLAPLAAGAGSCCSCRESARCAREDPAPFSISYISGGGFSGHHTGYLFSSDGRIWRVSGFPRKTENQELIDSLRQEDICLLKKFMESEQLHLLGQKETGNMTTTLSFQIADTTMYTLSWSGTMDELDLVPKALRPTVERIRKLVKIQ